jgi:hypothetical protein
MRKVIKSIFPIVIIVFVIVSACVAPPAPSSSGTPPSGGTSQPGAPGATQSPVATVPTFMYVTIETAYVTPKTTTPTPQITTVPTTIPPPVVWVEIYRSKQYFSYNKTAFSFDLKNPPMLIHYYLQPVNVTGKRIISTHSGTSIEKTEEVSYNYYSPYSWFEVTVRNKDTGQILVQNGFGNSYGKQYSQNVNQTIKVNNQGNLHIELEGNLITATVDVKVEKGENIV